MGKNKHLLFQNKEELEKVLPKGTKRLARIEGKKICLVHSGKKEVIAFHDECPHMSASLSAGFLNHQQQIICPWHAYRFNLESGEETNQRCGPLRFIEVLQEDGKIFLMV